MDSQALNDLHATIQAHGYAGGVELLRGLLEKAEADTVERRVLTWWKGLGAHQQHAALLAVYAHARKRTMSITTFADAAKVSLVLSRSRGFQGVYLGRVEVTNNEVWWYFYRNNEILGDRHSQM